MSSLSRDGVRTYRVKRFSYDIPIGVDGRDLPSNDRYSTMCSYRGLPRFLQNRG